MTYAETLKKGTSLCFTRSLELDSLQALSRAGIDCVELSFNYKYYMEEIDFPKNAEKYAEYASIAGIELWSIHLPFSRKLDISSTDTENRELMIATADKLIRAAGEIGIKTAVLHPSSEPITDEGRPERRRLSREAIIGLCETAQEAGVVLAIENLPRTCLCNRADEMIELLHGTGASVVFDTNHSLIQDNTDFLRELIDSGLNIRTLHISDYDFIDERHRLPGDGLNDWKKILMLLERGGYKGPLMYEVPETPKERDKITLEQLVQNMRALAAGEI